MSLFADSRVRLAAAVALAVLVTDQVTKAFVERGMTLVPVRMYFKNGRVKVAISLAKGKKEYDKRETIKKREVDRETRAAVKSRR